MPDFNEEKPTDWPQTKSRFLDRGGVWVVAQNLLTLAVLVVAPLFRTQWRGTATTAAGAVMLAAGAGLGLAGIRALGPNRTAYPKPTDGSALVQKGIYQYVRHPLYSSLIFVTVGWAMLWHSWAGLVTGGALTILLYAKALRDER